MRVLTIVGIGFCLLGAVLVASELLVRFKGHAYEIKSMTYSGQGIPEKTEAFARWERLRRRAMWAGLLCVALGSVLQIVAVTVAA